MIDIHLAGINALLDVMKFSVYVLAPLMMHRVLAKSDGRLVIHQQPELQLFAPDELAYEATQPNAQTCCGRCHDVFRIAGGQSNDLLLLRGPCDDAAPDKECYA